MTEFAPATGFTLPARIAVASRRPASLGTTPPGAVSLSMGEPFAGTDPRICDTAIAGILAGNTRYAPLTGLPALREAIAARLTSRHPRPVSAAEVVPTHGASAGLAATILALVEPGDRVVIPEPTYSLYADHVAMAGGEVIWVPNHRDGSLDLDRLVPALTGARMVVLCNPGNPSGAVLAREDLIALGTAVAEAGVWLVSDEAYRDIVFDHRAYFSSLDQADIAEFVICCGTFSKTYAMTGWRLGYVVAPRPAADAINLVHRTFNGAVSTFVQQAGITALELPDEWLAGTVRAYESRRDLVVSRLEGIDSITLAVPQGAFYAFPHVDMRISSDELAGRMSRAGVLVRSGREYGPSGEGHFRISFATDLDSLEEGLARVRSVVEGDLA
jgi:aspartate aminotransferase